MSNARVCIGAIAGAFGVRGEARVKPFTEDPEAIAAYGPVETEDGARRFDIRILRAIKGGMAVRLSGVATREEAEALKGTRLYVARDRLPEPGEEEFYHADLIGLTVEDLHGEPRGSVRAIHDHGAGDILEVVLPDAADTLLIPFTRDAVPHVDVRGGRVIVDMPAESE